MTNSMEYEIDKLSASESWRMFRIMAEIVEGFETLSDLPPCVSIFGSARTKASHHCYKEAQALAKALVNEGYGVITGGGPGIMEAGNKGATEAKGVSVGLHINLPNEQEINPFVNVECDFRYFFIRKLMFVKYSQAYIAMPGGMGTIDEMSEAFVLMQTNKIKPCPLILYGKNFWGGFIDWLKSSMLKEGYFKEEELDFVNICDSIEEVIEALNNFKNTHN